MPSIKFANKNMYVDLWIGGGGRRGGQLVNTEHYPRAQRHTINKNLNRIQLRQGLHGECNNRQVVLGRLHCVWVDSNERRILDGGGVRQDADVRLSGHGGTENGGGEHPGEHGRLGRWLGGERG